jgi:hypothetical protein
VSETDSWDVRGAAGVASLHLLAAVAVVVVAGLVAVRGGIRMVRALGMNETTEPNWPDSVSVQTELASGWRGKPPTVIAYVALARPGLQALVSIARYAIEVEAPYEPAERVRLIVSGAQSIDVT